MLLVYIINRFEISWFSSLQLYWTWNHVMQRKLSPNCDSFAFTVLIWLPSFSAITPAGVADKPNLNRALWNVNLSKSYRDSCRNLIRSLVRFSRRKNRTEWRRRVGDTHCAMWTQKSYDLKRKHRQRFVIVQLCVLICDWEWIDYENIAAQGFRMSRNKIKISVTRRFRFVANNSLDCR